MAAVLRSHGPQRVRKSGRHEPAAALRVRSSAKILDRLYQHDQRISPWAGTGLGVVQAVNTFEHHEGTVRGATRPKRNLLITVTGDFTRADRQALEQLQMARAA